jgi:hypothetical protein
MKYLLLLFLLFFGNLYSFGQKKEKEYLLEIIQLEQINHRLKLDSIQISQKIRNVKRWSNYEIERQKWINDSLRWELKKLKSENLKLDSLRRQLLNLSDSTVILYKDEKSNVCYINLSAYELILKQNDNIILKPIYDKLKWRTPIVDGYPRPKNLSLHLYPHKLNGDKLFLQP